MGKTYDLVKVVKTKLRTICSNVSYVVASDSDMYPHVVFTIDSVNTGDLSRKDYAIDIDIWDKSNDESTIETLADSIESIFNNINDPQSTILPTFFLLDRKIVNDEDKKIRHRLVRVLAQNYER